MAAAIIPANRRELEVRFSADPVKTAQLGAHLEFFSAEES